MIHNINRQCVTLTQYIQIYLFSKALPSVKMDIFHEKKNTRYCAFYLCGLVSE